MIKVTPKTLLRRKVKRGSIEQQPVQEAPAAACNSVHDVIHQEHCGKVQGDVRTQYDLQSQAVIGQGACDSSAAKVQGPHADCGGAHQEQDVCLQVGVGEHHNLPALPVQGQDDGEGRGGDVQQDHEICLQVGVDKRHVLPAQTVLDMRAMVVMLVGNRTSQETLVFRNLN